MSFDGVSVMTWGGLTETGQFMRPTVLPVLQQQPHDVIYQHGKEFFYLTTIQHILFYGYMASVISMEPES